MSQLDPSRLNQISSRHCHENILSNKTSLVGEPHIIKLTESNIVDKDINEMLYKNKVSTGTMTEEDNSERLQCRYCLRRMSVLQKIEKLKSFKGSLYDKNGCSKQTIRNRGCQTSASLYEQAEMSYREMRNLSIILSLRNEKSLRADTFCKCVANGTERDCRCGEEENKYLEWVWNSTKHGQATKLYEEGSLAVFHEDYSCGTTAVRGLKAMDKDQYFWEIKMSTPVYGTDMMTGVGTGNIDLNKFSNTFCSMLGSDFDSWGISYDGRIQHGGKKRKYCCRFGQGTIIGVHLDMWHGTLTFFKNRQSLGVAFAGLRGRTLYPMACSTAARSGMRVISSRSFPSSLQFLCCQKLRQCVPSRLSVLDTVPMPPGLRSFLANNIAWLLDVSHNISQKPSSGHICQICRPLKSELESPANDESGSDEERMKRVIRLRDSDDDTDEEELEDFSETALQRHSLANYIIETTLRSMSSRDHSSSSSDLPSNITAPSTSSDLSSDSIISLSSNSVSSSSYSSHSTPSGVKRARLDSSSCQDEDTDSENYIEEDDSSTERNETNVANLTGVCSGRKQFCQLGKRKQM